MLFIVNNIYKKAAYKGSQGAYFFWDCSTDPGYFVPYITISILFAFWFSRILLRYSQVPTENLPHKWHLFLLQCFLLAVLRFCSFIETSQVSARIAHLFLQSALPLRFLRILFLLVFHSESHKPTSLPCPLLMIDLSLQIREKNFYAFWYAIFPLKLSMIKWVLSTCLAHGDTVWKKKKVLALGLHIRLQWAWICEFHKCLVCSMPCPSLMGWAD